MAMDEFNDMIGKQGYSEEQLNMCRDIRKRGKNKVTIMMIMVVVMVKNMVGILMVLMVMMKNKVTITMILKPCEKLFPRMPTQLFPEI